MSYESKGMRQTAEQYKSPLSIWSLLAKTGGQVASGLRSQSLSKEEIARKEKEELAKRELEWNKARLEQAVSGSKQQMYFDEYGRPVVSRTDPNQIASLYQQWGNPNAIAPVPSAPSGRSLLDQFDQAPPTGQPNATGQVNYGTPQNANYYVPQTPTGNVPIKKNYPWRKQ